MGVVALKISRYPDGVSSISCSHWRGVRLVLPVMRGTLLGILIEDAEVPPRLV